MTEGHDRDDLCDTENSQLSNFDIKCNSKINWVPEATLEEPHLDDTSSTINDTPSTNGRHISTTVSWEDDFRPTRYRSRETSEFGGVFAGEYYIEKLNLQLNADGGDGERVDHQQNNPKGTFTQTSGFIDTKQPIIKSTGNKDFENEIPFEPSTSGSNFSSFRISDRAPAWEESVIQLPLGKLPDRCKVSPQSSIINSSPVTEYDSIISSEFEGDATGIDQSLLQPFTSIILDELLRIYFLGRSPLWRECPKSTQSGESTSQPKDHAPGLKQGSDTNRGSNIPILGKRKRRESDGQHSEDEGDEDQRRSNKPVLKSSEEVQSIFWACPFSKWRPLTYHKCQQYILKDISRVKQHLRRYHERPRYCPVCWEVFREDDKFETHIQGRHCSPQPKVDIEGVSSAQQKQLERRSDKQLSKPEQWYAIYETLFPGQPRPDNPYIESDLSAELISFQKFMATEGLPIVESKARENIPAHLFPHEDELLLFSQVLFQQAVPEILRKYEGTRPKNNNLRVHEERPQTELPLYHIDPEFGFGIITPASMDVPVANDAYRNPRTGPDALPIQSTTFDTSNLSFNSSSLDIDGTQLFQCVLNPAWPNDNSDLNWDLGKSN
ncbi:hypothetical protein M434DRAFT_396449 [Hypoxylon sp. CO27-5]|nr:hypothetical protein M434DRAFT_396449 [Hypoxylon sp. CO27-5]